MARQPVSVACLSAIGTQVIGAVSKVLAKIEFFSHLDFFAGRKLVIIVEG